MTGHAATNPDPSSRSRAEDADAPRAPLPSAGAHATAPVDPVEALERVRAGEATAQALRLRGATLVEADLSDLDLSGCDLSGADLSRANLEGARLFGAKLVGATLFEVRADGAELAGADLTDALLADGSYERAGFGRAVLAGADFSNARLAGASLTSADLSRAILAAADFRESRLCDARLSGADLTHATLDGADLTGACVDGARFDHASLAGTALSGTRSFRRASWLAVDLRDIDFSGAYLLRDFIQDQNFLDEFRRQSRLHEWIYRAWWLTSDCGRSAFRWAACGAIIALFFAGLYTQVSIDYGDYPTPLSPVYFSVVTFTTLGYGDALPTSAAAQAIVIAEVVAGYVMLGGLLSLITNKLARRAG